MFDLSDACPDSDDTADADSDSTPDGCDVCDGYIDASDSDGDETPDGCQTREPEIGDLILTEIFAIVDPGEGASDWVEIENVSGHPLEMANVLYLREELRPTGPGSILEPGELAVISGEGASESWVDFTAAGFDHEDMVGDESDAIILERAGLSGPLITVEYGEEDGFFNPTAEVSIGFGGDEDYGDSEDVAFWCEATSFFTGSSFGTTGEPNDACWTCGDGVQEGPEECDDAGTAPGDGCGYQCEWEGPNGCRDELVNTPELPYSVEFTTRDAIFEAECETLAEPLYHYVFTWRAREDGPVEVRVLDETGVTADVVVSIREEDCADGAPLFACGESGDDHGDIDVDVLGGDEYQIVVESTVLGASYTLELNALP